MFTNSGTKVSNFRKFYEDPIQYLDTYFRVGYYLCIIPFRFEKENASPETTPSNTSNGRFVARRRLPQQILCYMVYTWSLYKFVPSFYSTKFNKSNIATFDFVALLTTFGNRVTFIYFMVTKQEEIVAIVNYLLDDQLIEAKNGSSIIYRTGKIKWIVGSLTVFYTCIGAVYTLLGITVVDASNWSPQNIWAAYVGQAKFNIFSKATNDAVMFSEITTIEHIGTAFYVTLKCANQLIATVVSNGFLTLSLMYHHLARDFQVAMTQQHSDKNVPIFDGKATKIIDKFWRLRYFINEKVNRIYGPVLLWWMMEGVMYYSCYLDSIFSEKSRIKQFRNIIYILNFLTALLIASDAHYKIAGLKDWILEKQRQRFLRLTESDLIVILNALSPCDVGLKALGFFTVTYEFIGTLAHVIITYAVILLNFQGNTDQPLSFYGYNNIL